MDRRNTWGIEPLPDSGSHDHSPSARLPTYPHFMKNFTLSKNGMSCYRDDSLQLETILSRRLNCFTAE
uniref:Uncharacterized protein n=1 Tax=Magallana gigas TaxID=29159 RepID=K1QXX0_MAGGI